MPKLKQPFLLQSFCIKKLSNLLWFYSLNDPNCCQRSLVASYLSIPHHFYIKLKEEIEQRHQFHTCHFILFLDWGVTQFDLSKSNAHVDFNVVFQLASGSLKNVNYLNVSGYVEHIPLSTILRLPSAIPSIRSLHLAYKACSDAVVERLALHCLYLTSLDLTRCPVSDRGIPALGRLISLENLSILGTKVTVYGASALLISLKKLKVFNYERFIEVIIQLTANKVEVTLNLEFIHFCSIKQLDRFHSPCVFQTVAKSCPKLQHLTVNIWPDSHQIHNLLLFSCCPLLTVLELDVPHGPSLEFLKDILPIIQVFGPQLQEFGLCNVIDMDVTAVESSFCPCLCRLALAHNSYAPISSPKGSFENLVCLELSGLVPDDTLTHLLVKCPLLTVLDIHVCPTFSDEFLKSLSITALDKIKILSLSLCHEVSLQGLWPLLTSENSLCKISVNSCEKLKSCESVLFSWVESNNLDLEIEWIKHLPSISV